MNSWNRSIWLGQVDLRRFPWDKEGKKYSEQEEYQVQRPCGQERMAHVAGCRDWGLGLDRDIAEKAGSSQNRQELYPMGSNENPLKQWETSFFKVRLQAGVQYFPGTLSLGI